MAQDNEKIISDNIAGTLADMAVTKVPVGFDARLRDALAAEGKPAASKVTPVWTKKIVAAAAAFAVLTAGIFASMKVWRSNYGTQSNSASGDGYHESSKTEMTRNVDNQTENNQQPYNVAHASDSIAVVPGKEIAVYDSEQPADYAGDDTKSGYAEPQDASAGSLAEAERTLEQQGYPRSEYFDDSDDCSGAIAKLVESGKKYTVICYYSDGGYVIISGGDLPVSEDIIRYRLFSE